MPDATVDRLELAFQGGARLRGQGILLNSEHGTLVASDDGSYTEFSGAVQFVLTEGKLLNHDGVTDLEPGIYLVNCDGLWRHL